MSILEKVLWVTAIGVSISFALFVIFLWMEGDEDDNDVQWKDED